VKKLGVLDIAAFKYDYYPDVIRQFHCTVYFDDDRNMIWMTGSEQCYGTYADFCEALGYDAADESGYKVHSESAKPVSDISFCYPTLDRVAEPPALSGMYYSFNALAKFFHENLVCKPGCQRKIDVCDFIFCELKRSVLSRMTPGFYPFVQKFIDSRVNVKFAHSGERTKHALFTLGLSEGWLEHPQICRPSAPLFGSLGPSSSRHSPAPRRKSGAAKFFKNLWDMCKNTNDVAHQALVMSQDTRIR
jgi:hypothetical protein